MRIGIFFTDTDNPEEEMKTESRREEEDAVLLPGLVHVIVYIHVAKFVKKCEKLTPGYP